MKRIVKIEVTDGGDFIELACENNNDAQQLATILELIIDKYVPNGVIVLV